MQRNESLSGLASHHIPKVMERHGIMDAVHSHGGEHLRIHRGNLSHLLYGKRRGETTSRKVTSFLLG